LLRSLQPVESGEPLRDADKKEKGNAEENLGENALCSAALLDKPAVAPILDVAIGMARVPKRCRNSMPSLSFDPRRAAAGDVLELFERDLARVAAGAHQQGAVGDAQIDALLRGHALEETVRKTRGKAIAATDAVFDFEIGKRRAIEKFSIVPHDGRPIVDQRGFYSTQRRADDLDIGIVGDHTADHRAESAVVDFTLFNVDTFDFVAEDRLKVFLVADQTVDVGHKRFGRRDRFFRGPKFGTEIENGN